MLVHASAPGTRFAPGLTRRSLSGTVRGVQSRVRVWAEGSGLAPRAFTLLCVHFRRIFYANTDDRTTDADLHAAGPSPDIPTDHAQRMLGVVVCSASGITRFFASLYT